MRLSGVGDSACPEGVDDNRHECVRMPGAVRMEGTLRKRIGEFSIESLDLRRLAHPQEVALLVVSQMPWPCESGTVSRNDVTPRPCQV